MKSLVVRALAELAALIALVLAVVFLGDTLHLISADQTINILFAYVVFRVISNFFRLVRSNSRRKSDQLAVEEVRRNSEGALTNWSYVTSQFTVNVDFTAATVSIKAPHGRWKDQRNSSSSQKESVGAVTFTLPLKDFDIECKPITENNSRAIYRQVDPRMPGANGPAPGLLYEGQGTSDIKVVGYEVNFSWWPRIKSVVEQSGHLRVQETSDFERSLYGSLKEPISPQQFKNFTWPNVQTERKRIDEIENNALVATHRAAHP